MLCGSPYCTNLLNDNAGIVCNVCRGRTYCSASCELADRKHHKKYCNGNVIADSNSTHKEIRLVKAYDTIHKHSFLKFFLKRLGILEIAGSSLEFETLYPLCTTQYLSITLRPVEDPTAPGGWNHVRFFTAEAEPFAELPRPRSATASSATGRLIKKFPALTICYTVIPPIKSFAVSGFTKYIFYHSIRNLITQHISSRAENFTIQDLHREVAFNEYSWRDGLSNAGVVEDDMQDDDTNSVVSNNSSSVTRSPSLEPTEDNVQDDEDMEVSSNEDN